jgi:hypothetical protein
MIRAMLAAPLALTLTGCNQLADLGVIDHPAPKVEDTCGFGKLGRYRDVPASPNVLAEIGAIVGEKNLRAIRPGDAVTMDFRPDRLNVEIGAGGRIDRLRCG